MTMPVVDFWFDFASTYSYPAAMRADALADEAGRRDPLPAVPARPDLQGAGLGHLAVQHLRGQGPLHVARSRTALRRARHSVPAAVDRFRRTACSPRGSPSPAAAKAGTTISAAGVFRAQFGEGRRIDDPAVIGDILKAVGAPPRRRLRTRGVRSGQTEIARADRGGRPRSGFSARRASRSPDGELFWGNDRLEAPSPGPNGSRRAVIANRAGNRAAACGVIVKLAAGPLQPIFTPPRWPRLSSRGLFVWHASSETGPPGCYGSSRIGSPAFAMCSLACRIVNCPKWKIDAASTAVAWPSRMPSTM